MADPLVLAFDTSAAQCAAALVRGDHVLGRRIEPMARGQAERLVPMLEDLLAAAAIRWGELDGLAVCVGPGNFTGLRIAVATARGLALGLGIPAAGVTLFEALGHGRPGSVLVTLEDRRGELFAQRFESGAPAGAPAISGIAALGPVSAETLCLGHRAAEIASGTGGRAGSEATLADPVVLARIASTRLRDPDPPRPAPLYLRQADALPSSEPPTLILDDA